LAGWLDKSNWPAGIAQGGALGAK